MARRRKQTKRKAETRGQYLKRVGPEYEAKLRGNVITPQPSMTRFDIRAVVFGTASNKRRTEPARDMGVGSDLPHESSYTKRPLGMRRRQRRFENKCARVARRRNRR